LGDGGHGHYDLLNVEIAAHNRPLVIDPGRYTYSEQGSNRRRWFKSTAAHNTVCVDGLDQTPYRRGKPRGKIAQGRFVERLSARGFDVLCGEATSPVYEVLHTRRIFFVAGEYWIIADRLRGERPHMFDLRFHLAPEAQGNVTIEAQGENLVARVPECVLIFHSASELNVEQGWYAPSYGIKHPAPVLSASVEGVQKADFVTLIVPQNSKQHAPALNAITHEQSTVFEVSRPNSCGSTTDIVVWSESGEEFELESFHCRASAAWLRKSAEHTSLTACNVRGLEWNSCGTEPLFTNENPTRWIVWSEYGGVTLDDGRPL
jgi:hypothetical protein